MAGLVAVYPTDYAMADHHGNRRQAGLDQGAPFCNVNCGAATDRPSLTNCSAISWGMRRGRLSHGRGAGDGGPGWRATDHGIHLKGAVQLASCVFTRIASMIRGRRPLVTIACLPRFPSDLVDLLRSSATSSSFVVVEPCLSAGCSTSPRTHGHRAGCIPARRLSTDRGAAGG